MLFSFLLPNLFCLEGERFEQCFDYFLQMINVFILLVNLIIKFFNKHFQ